MEEKLRKSGIDIIGNVPWGTHICQFYETKEDLIDILVPYFKKGLENNEFCIWVTSQPFEVEDAKKALRKAVPDFDHYLEKGQIEVTSCTDLYVKKGIFDSQVVINGWVEKLNRALANGYDGLRLSENISWLEKESWKDFVEYEKQLDNIIDKYNIMALCTYSLNICDVTKTVEIASNHQFILARTDGKWGKIENYRRKKAEEVVLKATKDWELTFDVVPDLIAIIDDEYRIVRANTAMAARLNMAPEDCTGLTCYRVVHGTEEPPFFCPHRQLLKDELEHAAEIREDYLGGDFRVSVSPLHNLEGRLTGGIHIARDITRRKQAEEALQESEEKYHNIVETANEGICMVDAEARITYVNTKMAEMLGYGQEEFIGKFTWDFTDEEGKAIFQLNLEKGRQGIDETYEVKLSCKDGSPSWMLVSSKAFFNKEGKFTGSMGMLTDITKRKEAEEALITRENEFRTLAENSPDMIARFDRQNRHLYANPAARSVYGCSQEEIIGKTHSELGRTPEQVSFWEEYHQKVFATGEPETLEFLYMSPQGKEYCFNTQIVPEFVDGEVTSVLTISRDVGDIKKAEIKLKNTLDNLEEIVKARTNELEKAYESLKESERSLAEAQKMAHIGSWEWDIASDRAYWSEEMYRIFGRSPHELAPSFNEYLSYIHPDDRDYYYNSLQKAKKGDLFCIDYRIILANGEERMVHLKSEFVMNDKNLPLKIKGIVQDVTESKKAEEKIKTLLNAVESSDDAIITKSLDGIITSWNKGAEQIYGYSAEEILGKKVSILEPDNLKGEIKQLIKKIKQKEKIRHYKTLRLKKDGTIINVSITLSPVFDASGKLVAISAIVRDITKITKAEKLLEKIEDARKKEIHHRIKNNLQVISSLLDLQSEKFRDERVLEAFRESQNRVISMSLIHEELYRGEGTDKLDFSIYLRKLAENLFQTYSLRSKNICLYLDLEENAFFNMDTAVPLGIITNELISNSLKHAFQGKDQGEIHIKLCREEKNYETHTSFFSLTILDNGKGMPENIEFGRLDSLGLQLVGTLVDQLNGKMEYKQAQGTEFRITFNIAERL